MFQEEPTVENASPNGANDDGLQQKGLPKLYKRVFRQIVMQDQQVTRIVDSMIDYPMAVHETFKYGATLNMKGEPVEYLRARDNTRTSGTT